MLKAKFYKNYDGLMEQVTTYSGRKGDFLQSEITIILRILLRYQSYLFYKSLVGIQELLKSGLLMRMNFLTGQYPLHNQYPYNLENVNLMEVGALTILLLLYT